MTNDEILAHKVVDVPKWKSDARAYAVKQWDDDRIYLAELKRQRALQSDDAPMIEKIDGKIAALQERVDAGADLYYTEFEAAKVERHRKEAEAEAAKPGYKNRAEREAEAEAKRQAELSEAAARRAEAEAKAKADEDARIAAAVEAALAARGVS